MPHFPFPLAWRDQLEFAPSVFRGDRESNEDTESSAVDVMHPLQVNNNFRASREHLSDSFPQDCALIAKHDATVATKDEHVS